MNYFAHFYLDSLPGQPYYNLGLILPDLMGVYDRKWKVKERTGFSIASETALSLLNGVNRHEEVDQVFHESDFFKGYKNAIWERLKNTGFTNPPYRLFYLSHILVELLLDRILIRNFPRQGELMFEEMNSINDKHLRDFFSQTGTPEKNSFWSFFSTFREKQYIFEYVKDESFVYVLNMVNKRVGHPLFDDKKKNDLLAAVQDIEKSLIGNYSKLFREIQAVS